AECYIKGEESNAEKRSRDSRDRPVDRKSPERYHRRGNQRSSGHSNRGNEGTYQ
ncbi:hypothetical protein A2U01_0083990, partial [Trifolium medium]|nr:hypothetical protein [Trifolium medium]